MLCPNSGAVTIVPRPQWSESASWCSSTGAILGFPCQAWTLLCSSSNTAGCGSTATTRPARSGSHRGQAGQIADVGADVDHELPGFDKAVDRLGDARVEDSPDKDAVADRVGLVHAQLKAPRQPRYLGAASVEGADTSRHARRSARSGCSTYCGLLLRRGGSTCGRLSRRTPVETPGSERRRDVGTRRASRCHSGPGSTLRYSLPGVRLPVRLPASRPQ